MCTIEYISNHQKNFSFERSKWQYIVDSQGMLHYTSHSTYIVVNGLGWFQTMERTQNISLSLSAKELKQ